MPGMDGTAAARAIRRAMPDAGLKLVAFSASALETQRAAYLSSGFDAFMPKPFRVERINDCLAQLLHVSFVAEGDEPEPAAWPAGVDVGELDVPEPLLARIREAAESYQVTRLRHALEQLERCGDPQRAFAARLRASAVQYDMAGVLELVQRVAAGGGAA
jgi:CheY-like chemotaxis protein